MKNLLKFFACSAVLLFVAACQKDDEITTFSKQQEEAKMTTISFEEFKQNVNAYNELDRVARHKLEKIRVNDPNGFYYDTKDIVLITYKDLKTYTIPVYGGRERQKTFRNLVIQDKAGRNPHSFLLHYTLTNDDLIKLAENKPIPNLPEKTVLTAPDGGDEEYIFRASDGNCYYYAASFTPNPANSVQIFIEGLGVITAERVECPPDLGFTENDNGGGGDGGDGGDNGGGGIDNGMPINIYIPYPATPDTGPITNPAWPIGGGSPNIPDTPIITVPTTNLLFQRFKNQLPGDDYIWLLYEADQEIRDMIEDLLGNTGGNEYLEREEVANKLVDFMQDEDNEERVEFILDYLEEEDYSDESVALVEEIIDAINEYYELDSTPDDELIDDFTESVLNPEIDEFDEDDDDAGPSCESFNYTSTGSNWQEAAVTNIHFIVAVINPSTGGLSINITLDYPQPVLFGCPKVLNVGNTIITPGIAATVSAKALNRSIGESVSKYGNKPVTNAIVDIYFKSRLKHNFPLYLPGGRVNFNPSNYSVVPTPYQTNALGTGDCD